MICGVETEFGFHSQKKPKLIQDFFRLALKDKDATCMGGFHSDTGARIYLDTGEHPEYSTPECKSAKAVALSVRAGAQIMQNALESAAEIHYDKTARLFMNNASYDDNSYGCHENYMISEELFDDICFKVGERHRVMLAFLTSRQIIAGAGRWKMNFANNELTFKISQRSPFIEHTVGNSTTSSRSIINIRNEPHCSKRRLHIIVGDSNMSEFANWLKIGTTMIVLDLLERDLIKSDFVDFYVFPINMLIDSISSDFSLSERFESSIGMSTALESQRYFLKVAKKYVNPGMIDKWEVLKAWEFALDALKYNKESLVGYLDWVTKFYFSARYAKIKLGVDMPISDKTRVVTLSTKSCRVDDLEKIRGFCLGYHDISPRGIFAALTNSGKMYRVFTDDQIKMAMSSAPRTRARWRTILLRILKSKGIRVTLADWARIDVTMNKRFGKREASSFTNNNPLRYYIEEDFKKARSL